MRLTKHHGLGNDFLVLIDPGCDEPVGPDLARAVCDRHRGVGADGLIRVSDGDAEPYRMTLWNGDGSVAEMSGNGISCLGQALVVCGVAEGGELRVETDAGLRVVEVLEAVDARHHRMRVAMGTPRLGRMLPEWESDHVLRAVAVDMGNPHIVCHVPDPTLGPDIEHFGAQVNATVPAGANVELVSPGPSGTIVMAVYERGVGPTLACGTGAVASAAAARAWGLAPASVTVQQPGGAAVVELGDATDDQAHLSVPVEVVASVDWLA